MDQLSRCYRHRHKYWQKKKRTEQNEKKFALYMDDECEWALCACNLEWMGMSEWVSERMSFDIINSGHKCNLDVLHNLFSLFSHWAFGNAPHKRHEMATKIKQTNIHLLSRQCVSIFDKLQLEHYQNRGAKWLENRKKSNNNTRKTLMNFIIIARIGMNANEPRNEMFSQWNEMNVLIQVKLCPKTNVIFKSECSKQKFLSTVISKHA